MSTVYRVGDLRRIIKESATKNEFKAVYGGGVQDDNKKINRQAYKDIEKETSSYDGGVSKKKDSKPVTITSTYDCDITYESLVAGFYASPTYVNAGVNQITLNSDLVTADSAVVIITQKDGKTMKINVTFN